MTINEKALQEFLDSSNQHIASGLLTKGEVLAGITPESVQPTPETKARKFGAALLDTLIEGLDQRVGTGSFKTMLIETAIRLLVKAILVAIRAVFK